MSESLQDLDVGEMGRVVGFGEGSKAYRKRLLAMGLTPGVEFCVTRFAPMGDALREANSDGSPFQIVDSDAIDTSTQPLGALFPAQRCGRHEGALGAENARCDTGQIFPCFWYSFAAMLKC